MLLLPFVLLMALLLLPMMLELLPLPLFTDVRGDNTLRGAGKGGCCCGCEEEFVSCC